MEDSRGPSLLGLMYVSQGVKGRLTWSLRFLHNLWRLDVGDTTFMSEEHITLTTTLSLFDKNAGKPEGLAQYRRSPVADVDEFDVVSRHNEVLEIGLEFAIIPFLPQFGYHRLFI